MSTFGGHCTAHGQYWGESCPSCNVQFPSAPANPCFVLVPVLTRIADELVRVAMAIERGVERR